MPDSPHTADIVERLLRSKITKWLDFGAERHFINPDGPEAAAEIKALREALEAVDLARHTDAPKDWLRATKLTDAALKDHRKVQQP